LFSLGGGAGEPPDKPVRRHQITIESSIATIESLGKAIESRAKPGKLPDKPVRNAKITIESSDATI
jgi:hypothetical protein